MEKRDWLTGALTVPVILYYLYQRSSGSDKSTSQKRPLPKNLPREIEGTKDQEVPSSTASNLSKKATEFKENFYNPLLEISEKFIVGQYIDSYNSNAKNQVSYSTEPKQAHP